MGASTTPIIRWFSVDARANIWIDQCRLYVQLTFCNLSPEFQPPKHHTHKLPLVLSDALQRINGRDLTCEVAFYVNQPSERKRRINEHRRRAINAVIAAILHHVNIISKRVLASAEALADFCGLSTVSEAGNKSITRCTRALSQLKALGFIDYERRWDRVNKQYWPAKIEIRDQLLETVGITEQAWRRAVSQKLNYFNAKNSERLKKAITEADYKRIVIQEQMENVWRQRKTAREIKAKQKAAERAARLVREKERPNFVIKSLERLARNLLMACIPELTLHIYDPSLSSVITG